MGLVRSGGGMVRYGPGREWGGMVRYGPGQKWGWNGEVWAWSEVGVEW